MNARTNSLHRASVFVALLASLMTGQLQADMPVDFPVKTSGVELRYSDLTVPVLAQP